MTAYGRAVTVVRPAIVRSAALNDPDCSNQYELPFAVLTSYGVKSEDAKVAWVRSLGVNESLSIIAADASSGVVVGDVVTEVAGYSSSNTFKLLNELVDVRDSGRLFKLKLASGREVSITPLKLCRGHVVVAPPSTVAAQSYHWAAVTHPQSVFNTSLTPDEAAWVVLWTQGLSEEGGARMKTYSYIVGGLKWGGMIAIGVATNGAAFAASGAAAAGGASVAVIVGNAAAITLAGQATNMLVSAAANKASLSGVNGIASGVFDKADKWTFDNMRKLGMNARAGMTLHEKMVQQGTAANAFALDEERLTKMRILVAALPLEAKTAAIETPPSTAVEVFSVSASSENETADLSAVLVPSNALIPVAAPE